MGGAFDMPRQNMPDRSARAHRGVEGVDGCAGNAESAGHAFTLEHPNGSIHSTHSRHHILAG
jgi:hypothetical protein